MNLYKYINKEKKLNRKRKENYFKYTTINI